jgi:hypothetical protein
MASILIQLNPEQLHVAQEVVDKIVATCAQVEDLQDHVMVSGPLRHPMTQELTITVFAHESEEIPQLFMQTMSKLFSADPVCRAVRELVSGLPPV